MTNGSAGLKAIILAGGKGTRLRPFTASFPKPLVPLGDTPVVEVLIKRLIEFGITDVTLTLGHLAELMRAYFASRDQLTNRLNLNFVVEEKPTGTAGSVSLVPNLNDTFLVMNGDLLTDLNFHELVDFHRSKAAMLTIATRQREVKIDLGVLEYNESNEIVAYHEKPETTYDVSMGVYVYEPSALNFIVPGQRLDLPDLVLKLIGAGERVCAFPTDCQWLDIGRPDDYARAQELFEQQPDSFIRVQQFTARDFNPTKQVDIGPMINANTNAVVVSDVFGQRGGAYRVTSLLCQTLVECGYNVTCFATWVDADSNQEIAGLRIVRPMIKQGYRWDIPNRVLAGQASRFIHRAKPDAVFVIGLTKVCGHLLDKKVADQLLIWELTNAEPNNKFVDDKAARLLTRCRHVLSPAETIDSGIRSTYDYQGSIKRLPFWIEDEGLECDLSRNQFRADFLFLARREDDKGLRELIEATAILAKHNAGIKVLVAGPGDERPYSVLSSQLNVSNQIEFCSLPSRREAMDALAACRFLVLPSYHEGYPLSLLEAAQHSVPFIASDVGSIREVFGECSACCLVRPRDVQSLSQAMKSWLSLDESQYKTLRQAAHRRFVDLSSRESVQRRLGALMASDVNSN